jgi:D-glycerate 3-kinase
VVRQGQGRRRDQRRTGLGQVHALPVSRNAADRTQPAVGNAVARRPLPDPRRTRGVPGTHDIALGETILDDLLAGRTAALPRFDKATDDRAPMRRVIEPPVDVVLLEGWCVGAVPQTAEALAEPINALERDEDPDGAWRSEVNRRLATDYAGLFGQLDLLFMLRVAGFEAVRANRLLQEQKLAASRPEGTAIMNGAALDRFLMHYERLTRWMLEEMPGRADVVIEIGADQRPL